MKGAPNSGKPQTPQEKKAALKKYLASLDPEKRKKVVAALAKKQKAKQAKKAKGEQSAAQPDAEAFSSESQQQEPQRRDPESQERKPSPVKPNSSRPARSSRALSTRTLSKNLYRKASGKQLNRRAIQILCLFVFLGLGAGWFGFIYIDQSTVFLIMEKSDKGLEALHDDDMDVAKDNFQTALLAFTSYNKTRNAWWRRPDTQLVPQMLRVAKGWGVVGDYQNALETFRQTALFLPDSVNSWQMDEFKKRFDEFLSPEFWSQTDAATLYRLMISADPDAWGNAGPYLIEMSERVGFWLSPMYQRVRDANIIIYGTPRAVSDGKGGEFAVDAEIIYKAQRDPGMVYIKPIEEFLPIEQQRLEWYLSCSEKCIIFAATKEDHIQLNSIEGILVSRPSIVEEFNSIILSSN